LPTDRPLIFRVQSTGGHTTVRHAVAVVIRQLIKTFSRRLICDMCSGKLM